MLRVIFPQGNFGIGHLRCSTSHRFPIVPKHDLTYVSELDQQPCAFQPFSSSYQTKRNQPSIVVKPFVVNSILNQIPIEDDEIEEDVDSTSSSRKKKKNY